MPQSSPLRTAVIGAGSFGRNHVRVYSELADAGAAQLVAIVDAAATPDRLELARNHGARFFFSVDQLLAAVQQRELPLDAASVCVPTSLHSAVASQLLRAGVPVLVEKPLAPTLAEADELLNLAATRNLVLQVGHLERFNPAVTALLPYLDRPMFFECHRLSIFTPRSLDVDVVLDLMIHDLDIVLRMAQSEVREIRAVGLPVLSRHTDIANVRLEFSSGCVANFTASRVSTERVRKLRFFQPHEYISVDYARQDALIVNVAKVALDSPQSSTNPADLNLANLKFTKLDITPGEPLRLEIEAFLEAVRTGQPSPVPAQQSRDALALALAVNETIAEHRQRTGLTTA
jgi:predicted dehydrogenase